MSKKDKIHFLYKDFWPLTGRKETLVACDNMIQGPLAGTFDKKKVTCKSCKRAKRFKKNGLNSLKKIKEI